jgi:hypothetical protein
MSTNCYRRINNILLATGQELDDAGAKIGRNKISSYYQPQWDFSQRTTDRSMTLTIHPHLMPRPIHRSKARGYATSLYFHLVQFGLDESSSIRLELNSIS